MGCTGEVMVVGQVVYWVDSLKCDLKRYFFGEL